MNNGVTVKYYKNESGAFVDYVDLASNKVLRTANLLDAADYDVLTSDEKDSILQGLKDMGISDNELESTARMIYEEMDNKMSCNVTFTEQEGKEVATFDLGGVACFGIEVGTFKKVRPENV